MAKYRIEYRINKKGAECFRTRDGQQARQKLNDLSAKRPGVYTMQTRSVQLDRFGMECTDLSGRPLWSAWN